MAKELVASDFHKEKPTEWLVVVPDLPNSMEKRPHHVM
jgi:hypothetical protein